MRALPGSGEGQGGGGGGGSGGGILRGMLPTAQSIQPIIPAAGAGREPRRRRRGVRRAAVRRPTGGSALGSGAQCDAVFQLCVRVFVRACVRLCACVREVQLRPAAGPESPPGPALDQGPNRPIHLAPSPAAAAAAAATAADATTARLSLDPSFPLLCPLSPASSSHPRRERTLRLRFGRGEGEGGRGMAFVGLCHTANCLYRGQTVPQW